MEIPYDGYYSMYMMLNKDLQVLVPLTHMRQNVIFGRSDELRVEDGVTWLQQCERSLATLSISLNGDPTIDSDGDGYGDYYEQLLARMRTIQMCRCKMVT